MRYADSSVLLKLLWTEPESAAVRAAVAAEQRLVVSTLAELEVEVQLRARWHAGAVTRPRYRAYRTGLAGFRLIDPFEFVELPGDVFRRGVAQHSTSRRHCRTLDRLHLAAMEVLGLTALLTNDHKQAEAARDLGFDVVIPE